MPNVSAPSHTHSNVDYPQLYCVPSRSFSLGFAVLAVLHIYYLQKIYRYVSTAHFVTVENARADLYKPLPTMVEFLLAINSPEQRVIKAQYFHLFILNEICTPRLLDVRFSDIYDNINAISVLRREFSPCPHILASYTMLILSSFNE